MANLKCKHFFQEISCMNHVRPPGRIAEAAFFFPKLCFAPREGENAANLRQKRIRETASKTPFPPTDLSISQSAANGLAPPLAAGQLPYRFWLERE
jgi:hypothetical protein